MDNKISYNQGMGTLYVVATPIGNLGDITLRAIEILKMCDVVVCEDTRVTGKLLAHLDIKKRMVSFNEYNEQERVFDVVEALLSGLSVALVSDAGTPLVSDPGFLLLSLAQKHDIEVISVPGASAFVAALSISGLPVSSVLFLGFLPKKKQQKLRSLSSIRDGIVLFQKTCVPTIAIYESPTRVQETLKCVFEIFGNVEVVVAREITKIHEEVYRGEIKEYLESHSQRTLKGEFCILISPIVILN